MKKDTVFILIGFALVLGVYTYFHVSSKQRIQESFQAPLKAPIQMTSGSTAISVGSTEEVDLTPVEVPYAQQPINNLDEYEVNAVYQNESDQAMSRALRDKLMSQRPMDWAGLPPSSSAFQAGLQESFQNAQPTVPDDAKPYQNIGGDLMQPPDMSEMEKKERQILQTYKPMFPPTPTSYDPRDADELIKQIYDLKGLIPNVKHKDGTNVYEIVGVRKKDEKVMFEDEAEVSDEPNENAMESAINPPQAVTDMNNSKDPFFDSGSQAVDMKSRTKKWNYTSWTPGLERMFAPTEPQQQWY